MKNKDEIKFVIEKVIKMNKGFAASFVMEEGLFLVIDRDKEQKIVETIAKRLKKFDLSEITIDGEPIETIDINVILGVMNYGTVAYKDEIFYCMNCNRFEYKEEGKYKITKDGIICYVCNA